MQNRLAFRSGFTLIEISIVLVIIALVAGGVLMGHEMVSQAQLRKVGGDIERYKTAVNTFRIKYGCLPGDCPNAIAIWGAASAGCQSASRGAIIASGGTGTCNGNGDNKIYDYAVYQTDIYVRSEIPMFWQQLSLASLVERSYSGVWQGSWYNLVAGVTAPATIRNGGVSYFYDATGNMAAYAPRSCCGYFQVGGSDVNSGFSGGLFAPAEAKSLDLKFDDGLINSGNIFEISWLGWSVPNCADTNAVARKYDLTHNSPTCAPQFLFNP